MKKIIGGKVYDTEKARQVGDSWSPDGFGPVDFQWCEETLYRKRTGEYFLYGEGGPMSRYAEPYGQSGWTGGARIMPLDYDRAREWAEGHLEPDDYVEEFGVPDEGDGETAHLSLTIPAWAYRAIKDEATRRGCPMGDLVTEYARTL